MSNQKSCSPYSKPLYDLCGQNYLKPLPFNKKNDIINIDEPLGEFADRAGRQWITIRKKRKTQISIYNDRNENRVLIWQNKNLGGFKTRVLLASFKNETIGRLSYKKMVKCGMPNLEFEVIALKKTGRPPMTDAQYKIKDAIRRGA